MMQKRRPHGSCEQAVSYAIGLMGAGDMADAIGRTARLIYAASDPDDDHMLRWDQAIDIDQAFVDAGHEGVPPMLAHHMAALGHSDLDPAGNLGSFDKEANDVHIALAALLIHARNTEHFPAEKRAMMLDAVADAERQLAELKAVVRRDTSPAMAVVPGAAE